ncbi:MAG: MBL fold metallo-hydrolase [Tepidisphaeraceae bacterium]
MVRRDAVERRSVLEDGDGFRVDSRFGAEGVAHPPTPKAQATAAAQIVFHPLPVIRERAGLRARVLDEKTALTLTLSRSTGRGDHRASFGSKVEIVSSSTHSPCCVSRCAVNNPAPWLSGSTSSASARSPAICSGTRRPRAGSDTPPARCCAGKRNILVDPGLPPAVLQARLFERTGLQPEAITDVFLTHASTASALGLDVLEKAKWFASEAERETLEQLAEAQGESIPELQQLLDRVTVAPDKLAPAIDLFPLAGFTVGTCGLLVAAPLSTTLITGPAVGSLDHFLAGQVLPDCADVAAAKESLQEVYEIADIVVPGHDNWFQNPRGVGQ